MLVYDFVVYEALSHKGSDLAASRVLAKHIQALARRRMLGSCDREGSRSLFGEKAPRISF